MTRRLRMTAAEGDRGQRLDAVVARWLRRDLDRPLSKARLRTLIMAGAIRVEGKAWRRPGQPVVPGLCLEAVVRLDFLERDGTPKDRVFRVTSKDILYEDDVLIAVNKPPGLPVHTTADPRRAHLFGVVKAFLEDRRAGLPRGGFAYLGSHQRLDRDTSGVVVFAKDRRANPGLAAAFSGRKVVKIYHALTRRPALLPGRAWECRSLLGEVGKPREGRVAVVASGGHWAETSFFLLEDLGPALLMDVRPWTGRKHQIRLQLAAQGMPVLGDDLYGDGPRGPLGLAIPRLMLHASSLQFSHPISGLPLNLRSPHPADFREALRALRAKGAAGA